MPRPRIHLGCTGWAYDDWKGGFYPAHCGPQEYLERYAQVFSFTEVDSSFYATPSLQTTQRWSTITPSDFVFSLKFPRTITHEKRLRQVETERDEFLENLKPLRKAKKLGPLVLQLPPSFVAGQDRRALAEFLDAWPSSLRIAVELRDPSWWQPDALEVLTRHGAALVWSVTAFGDAPAVRTGDFVYLRFVGDRALTRFDRVQRDLEPVMREWSPHLRALKEHEGFVVVNNHFMGFAPASARVAASVFGLPLPELERASRRRHQTGLAQFGQDALGG